MVSLEDIQKTIKWLRDTTNENVIYIDKDLKRELGNVINDLLKLNEIYKARIDKAIEYIKEHSEMTDLQIYGIENVLAFRGSLKELLEILGDKENE